MKIDILNMKLLVKKEKLIEEEIIACAIAQYGLLVFEMNLGIIKYVSKFKKEH